MDKLSSKDGEKRAAKVELKPLPSYLRYEFFDLDHNFADIVSSKLDGSQLEKTIRCA